MPSKKILEQKKQTVSAFAEDLKTARTGVVVNYKGINVEDDTKLRKEMREAGCKYKVVKNTILVRALQEAGIAGLDDVLKGTTAVAVHPEDYIAPARILAKYADSSKTFEIKAGFIDGKFAGPEEIEKLAKLPSKEELIAQTLRGLNAPISGLVTVLNGTIRGLVIALNAIAEKQKKSA